MSHTYLTSQELSELIKYSQIHEIGAKTLLRKFELNSY